MKVQRTWFTQKGVESLCFCRTPDTVVIGLQAKAASAVVVLDARTGAERHRAAVPWVGAVATAGGKVYASVGADEVLAWDDAECRTPPHRATVEGSGRHFAASPDGQLFWIDAQGGLWVGGRLANQVRAAGTSAVVVGDSVVTGHLDGKIRVWSRADPGKRPRAVASGGSRVVVAHAHGRSFSRTQDGAVARWDAAVKTAEVRWSAPSAQFNWTVAPGPGDRVATCARGVPVQVWTDEGAPLGEWSPPAPIVHQLAFDDDGLWVACDGRLLQVTLPE